ncbi:MAG: hypothetical protein IPK21_24165 [Haliscomenobacter sp.]|nr:hypothetical protein [Haliscomenobacter sp.]
MARLFGIRPDPTSPDSISTAQTPVTPAAPRFAKNATYLGSRTSSYRNLDSALLFQIKAETEKSYGNIRLKLSGLDTIYPYLRNCCWPRALPPAAPRSRRRNRELEFLLLPRPLPCGWRRPQPGVWDSGKKARSNPNG